MKKGLFNASFEESKNLVNDNYIHKALEGTQKKPIRKRLLGVISLGCIILTFVLLVSFLENTYNTIIQFKKISPVWFVLIFGLNIHYLYLYFKSQKKRILNNYYFQRMMSMLLLLLLTTVHLFFSNIGLRSPNTLIAYLIYTFFLVTFVIRRILVTKGKIKNELYKDKTESNKIIEWVDLFVSFANKYGGVVILGLFIYRTFFRNDHSSINNLLEMAYLLISAPVAMVIGILFIFGIFRSEVMPGYYMKKYYNEYRIEYGFTEEKWNKGMDFEEGKRK